MRKFSEVQKSRGNFEGDKIKIDDILGRTIRITGYSVTNSRYHDRCLTLQFLIEEEVTAPDGTRGKGWVQHSCFTGSEALMRQMDGLEIEPSDPILAKIIKCKLNGDRCFYKIVDPD